MCNITINHQVFLLIYTIFLLNINYCTSTNISMMEISKNLGADFEQLKIKELGTEYIDMIYSKFKYTTTIIDANETINEISKKLEEKIIEIFAALQYAKSTIENLQILDNDTNIHPSLVPCVKNRQNYTKFCDNQFNTALHEASNNQLHVDYVLQRLRMKIKSMKNAIKQQYFLSTSDNLSVSPFINCHNINHILLWNNYMSRITYNKRKIILLIDHGGSLSKYHFSLVKAVAKQMITMLTDNDKISLLTISNDWSSPELSDECLMPNKIPSTINNNKIPKFFSVDNTRKKLLNQFIDGLKKGNGATNHSLGLLNALKIIKNDKVQNEPVMILYISRGLLSSLTEARTVLEIIIESSKNLYNSFIINTCAVVDETRPPMYETQFLQDLALQDYKKFNISNQSGNAGIMIIVNSTETIGFAVNHFYDSYKANVYNLNEKISLPTWDNKSKDLMVTFSIGSSLNNQFNMIGIDIYFNKLIDDITNFCGYYKNHYAFLMDLQGRIILHPSFTCPINVEQQLNYVDLLNFEIFRESKILKNRLLNESSGTYITTQFGLIIKYIWRRVGDWYVVCFVQREIHTVRPYRVSTIHNTDLIYHDVTKSNNSVACRHLNKIATLDASSLYLSVSCFHSIENFENMKKHDIIQNYMAYIQDNSGLLSNPGLKDEIKDEVSSLASILNYLRLQHLTSIKSKYIVRRYVASSNGVVEMFPGSILDNNFEPTKRPWYIQAIEHRSKLILTPPYLDEGGAGYIVTLAYATSYVVVAIDVTYGFIYRTLLKRMPLCSLSNNITCFIMDDRGYLIYHPNLIDPNGHGPIEKQHIVHKESLVANDILNNKLFIQKMLCNSYGGGTIQRYYKLNTSYNEILSNTVHGESCIKYQISHIQHTNIFLGIINASCNIVITFCPCSIIDRLCFNCHRMEQKECECPCECPIEQTKCNELNMNDNPICTWFPEHVSYSAKFNQKADIDMKSCFPTNCHLEQSHFSCLGITGCEWCKYDVDGSLLKYPFCAPLTTCFNGIVGSLSPYENLLDNKQLPTNSYNIPISFIVLSIIGLLIILFIIYFHNRSSSSPQVTERLYLSSTQDNHLRMSDLNINDNYHTIGNHHDKLLQDDKPDPVSPYCVSSGYRRIAMTADSDHGYSTMTQHDESEHMSLAPIEFDSIEDDLKSDNASMNTNVSIRPSQNEQFTCVPINRNNRIIVPVTVHRNMEMT